MTTLAKTSATFGVVCSIALLIYDTLWYLILHKDPSQFIAFALIGVGLCALSLILYIFYEKISLMKKTIEYFEDNLLDRFPELNKQGGK